MNLRIYFIIIFTLIFTTGFSQTKEHDKDLLNNDDIRISNLNNKELHLLSDVRILARQLMDDEIPLTGSYPDDNNLFKNVSVQPVKKSKANPLFNTSIHMLDTAKYHPEYPEYNKKLNLLIPMAEVVGFNIGLSTFNNYVGHASYAKISFKSAKHNLDTGFVWDDDVFTVNEFAHPYHGGIFFNTARSSGYSFWESAPFSMGGSLIWEFFMETDPPQTNDLINTTLGGMLYGEILYRLSSLVLDESKTGSTRVLNEVLGTVIDPMRAFNRLIKGDMWRVTPTNVHDVYRLTSELHIGYAGISPNEQVNFEKHHIMAEWNLFYGDPFDKGTFKPFDNFRLRVGLDAGKGDGPSFWANAYGILYGKNVISNPERRFILGAFQDYDFFSNQLFHMGAQSIGGGFIYITPRDAKWKYIAEVHTNFIPIAALNTFYKYGNRDYDWLIGNKSMFETAVMYGPLRLALEYKVFFMKTVHGAPGNHTVGMFNPKLFCNIYDGLGIGAEYTLYHRFGSFDNVAENYSKRISEQRLFLTYRF